MYLTISASDSPAGPTMNCVVCLTFSNREPLAVSWLMRLIGPMISRR